jgi:hypothetical protein
MSEAAPVIPFHQRRVNCHFQAASSGLHESFHEGSWKPQRSVSCPSVPAQYAAANPKFCPVYLSLRDQFGVLELVIWYKDALALRLEEELDFDQPGNIVCCFTLVVYDRDPPPLAFVTRRWFHSCGILT